MAGLLDLLSANGQFMDNAGNVYPQGGGILDPIAQTPDLAQAAKFDWGAGNPLWSMLMGLGAGIAGGTGYNSKQRLASGLSQGLGSAAALGQQARNENLRLEELKNEAADRKAQLALGLANFNLNSQLRNDENTRAASAAQKDESKTASAVNLLVSAAPSFADAKAASEGSWVGLGMDAAKKTFTNLATGILLLNGQSPTAEAISALVPQTGERADARAQKVSVLENYLKLLPDQLANGGYQTLGPQIEKLKSIPFESAATPPPVTPAAPSAPNTQASASSAPSIPTSKIPPKLAGKSLQFNPAMNLYRDKATGDLYNINGDPVGQ